MRADVALYAEGLKALRGRMLVTTASAVIQIVDIGLSGASWAVRYFYWNGPTRRLRSATTDTARAEFLELLKDAWPYERGQGDAFHDEAQARLGKALAYGHMDDIVLVARNFEPLRRRSGDILGQPQLRDGEVNGLHAAFCYFGKKRFPVSGLLKAWDEGKWRIECPSAAPPRHDAFVISGGGGLSTGRVYAYCPVCGGLKTMGAAFGRFFGEMADYKAAASDGFRLDEIIEEIGGTLPGPEPGAGG